MNRFVIGIDPGVKGGITVLKNRKIIECIPMPTFDHDTGKKSKKLKKPIIKKYVDGKKLIELISQHPESEIFLEQIHAIFGQSAGSGFAMGEGYGIIQGIIRGLGRSYYLTRSKLWQSEVWIDSDIVKEANNPKKTDTKATSLNAATRLFPDQDFLSGPRKRVPHDGMFDSSLIAYYGDKYLEESEGE